MVRETPLTTIIKRERNKSLQLKGSLKSPQKIATIISIRVIFKCCSNLLWNKY